MHKILKRKYKETDGKIRHSLGYYAQMIASQTGMKLNWRELEQEYLNMYGKTMFENFADGKNPGDKGSLKAKVKGKVTLSKAKKLKSKKNATPRDKQLANWFINMHKGKKKKK